MSVLTPAAPSKTSFRRPTKIERFAQPAKRPRPRTIRSTNYRAVQCAMEWLGQFSHHRRRITRMCDECLVNQHALCEKPGCPCLCNDPR